MNQDAQDIIAATKMENTDEEECKLEETSCHNEPPIPLAMHDSDDNGGYEERNTNNLQLIEPDDIDVAPFCRLITGRKRQHLLTTLMTLL